MIQYISSENVKGSKIILWRMGNYQYQIEITQNGITETRNIEAEYTDAMNQFTKIVEQMDLFKI